MDREFWGMIWLISTVASLIIIFSWVLFDRDRKEELP